MPSPSRPGSAEQPAISSLPRPAGALPGVSADGGPRRSGLPADGGESSWGEGPAAEIMRRGARSGRLVHVARMPAQAGRTAPWPAWLPASIVQALTAAGVRQLWAHQAAAAQHAFHGRNVIISTPAASGKSLGYLLPALTAVMSGGTVLYLAPTRALAADQLRAVAALRLPGVCAAVVDGDTPQADREWARSHANYLLTTPDMLHHVLLPRHNRWKGLFGQLRYVIVDECHGYRGVFGSHVAQVLRRLRRVAAHHAPDRRGRRGSALPGGQARPGQDGPAAQGPVPPGPGSPGPVLPGPVPPGAPAQDGDGPRGPVFLLASATVSDPRSCAQLLTGQDTEVVTGSCAPRGPLTFGLWEPPLTGARGDRGSPVRRPATVEAATLLADLVGGGVRALAFTRSRRGAEAVALSAKRALASGPAPGVAHRVAAYRSGYLPEDRRALEEALRGGQILGLATTTALELGVNISGLDAVLIAGWPGSRAALWQQAGRAGREGQPAAAVLIARDDPLDTYLVHHPSALLGRPVEATVLDPRNPYVLAPHLCAAAAELPLAGTDLALFGPTAASVSNDLVLGGLLRRRGHRLYCTRTGWASGTGLRGAGGLPVKIIEAGTGRLVGTVDEPSAHMLVHTGAVYPHQGEMYLVKELNAAEGVALVEQRDPGYVTSAEGTTGIEVITELRRMEWGPAGVHFGEVEVVRQVTSFLRRDPETGKALGGEVLDLPPRALRTRAVWWTVSPGQRAGLRRSGVDLGGAAHAAEHTAIGLLPLFASCDRMDIGGVSADLHPATGRLTVFVYDGHEGGAGFAERGFAVARDWLRATTEAIVSCECQAGCPSCIQSPKCGSGNEPLSKDGAVILLERLLRRSRRTPEPSPAEVSPHSGAPGFLEAGTRSGICAAAAGSGPSTGPAGAGASARSSAGAGAGAGAASGGGAVPSTRGTSKSP